MDTMFRFANNVPGPSFGIQYVQHPEVDTFMGCEEASYKFRTPIGPEGRSLKKAVGFMYNRKTGECSIAATANASLLGNTDYQAAPDKDFYVYSGFCGRFILQCFKRYFSKIGVHGGKGRRHIHVQISNGF